MKNYIEIPELKEVAEKSYSEDDVQLVVNNYFKATRERLNLILIDTKNYTKEQIEEILKLLWYAENNVKDEKSILDMNEILSGTARIEYDYSQMIKKEYLNE